MKRITQKNKNGTERTYLHLVECRRINGKPRHVLLVNLGRIDSEKGREKIETLTEALIEASERLRIFDAARDLRADWSKEYGPALVFKRLWNELGLGKVLRSELCNISTDFDLTEAIFNMVLNRLSEPGSKRQMSLWEQNSVYGIEPFELQHYYRAMDYLIEHKDRIETGIFSQMKDLLNQKVDMVLFDTTSLVYYGDGKKSEGLLEHGFSKERRGDLKQVVVGVLMSKEGIPLGHEVFNGNTNDVSCFKEIIDKVSDKFGLRRVVMVGDRGMISQTNIRYLEEHDYEYILGYRMRTIPKSDRREIFSKAGLKQIRKLKLKFKEVEYKDRRLVVYYNPERAEEDRLYREKMLGKILEKIRGGTILSVVDNPHYRRYLKIQGENPVIDDGKVERDSQYDGIFVLTSNTSIKALELVEYYKNLWQVEHAFRQLKTELEVGPIYHWKDRRIRAHIMICFLAFILRTILYKKLKAMDKDFSWLEVITALKALHAIGMKVGDQSVIIRTELQPGANLAFRAIGMRPPNRILSVSNSKTAVVIRQS